jgi:hypothetical protein
MIEKEKQKLTKEQLIGMKVFDGEGRSVGVVKNLISDERTEAQRFLEITRIYQETEPGPEDNFLLPVGMAMYDSEKRLITLPDLETDTVQNLPYYQPGESISEYEHAILQVVVPQPGRIARNPEEFFHFEHSDADIFYNKNS